MDTDIIITGNTIVGGCTVRIAEVTPGVIVRGNTVIDRPTAERDRGRGQAEAE